jgi:N-acetylmuramoyl-L-alanine amidase
VQVLLTRDADVLVPIDARIATANHTRGDLYLSLHFDAVPGTNARGITATVAPPLGFDTGTAFAAASPGGARPIALIPWRDAAGRYSADSRGVAELLLAALASQGAGPTRLRQARGDCTFQGWQIIA